MFFSQDWRERIKAENPDAGFGECSWSPSLSASPVADKTRVIGEIGKLLGAKWKELDDDEKKVCSSCTVGVCGTDLSHYSPTSTRLQPTSRGPRRRRTLTMYVLAFIRAFVRCLRFFAGQEGRQR